MPTQRRPKAEPQKITPEQFLTDYPPNIQALANELRALIKQTIPVTLERVALGWELIGYKVVQQKRTIYPVRIMPKMDQVQLGFEDGVLMADPERILEGTGSQLRVIPVTKAADIQRDQFARYILEAARVAVLTPEQKIAILHDRDLLRSADKKER